MSARASRADRNSRAFTGALVAFYAAVTFVYLVLPVLHRFGSVLLGSRLLPVDALLASGIMEWGFQSLYSPGLHVFDWNAGFPLHNTLAVTENLLGWQIFYSPLRWVGLGVPAAYNVTLLLSLVISAAGAALFSRRLGASKAGAALAGLVFGLGPFHLANLMHIQTMSVCWVPFALLSLDRYLENRRARDAALLTFFFVITGLSGVYFGVFLALMIVVYVACSRLFGRARELSTALAGLAAAGVIAVLVLSPVIYHYVVFLTANGSYREPVANVASLSMDVTAPLRTPAFQLAWSASRLSNGAWNGAPAFPGLIAAILVCIALVPRRGDSDERRVVHIVVAMSVVAFLLALGPRIQILGRTYLPSLPTPGQLWLLIPGIRWPSRIFFFAWLGVSVLAGIGLSRVQALVAQRVARFAGLAALLLATAEYWPAAWLSSQSRHVTEPIAMSDSYLFLSRESDSGGVVELPLNSGGRRNEDLAATYMYGASGHLRRIVALHGSRPVPLIDSLTRSAERLPESASARLLRRTGVNRIVVHRFLGDSASADTMIASLESAGYAVFFSGRESVVFGVGGR